MNKLKGKITVELTLEEVNKINALLERDEAKPLVEDGYTKKDGERHTFYRCSVCNEIITDDVFCPGCGQRVDHDNITF